MAKSSVIQLIPSGGVLAAAIGAALVAAILVNVYVGYVKSEYEAGSRVFYQLKEDIEAGTPIADRHLAQVRIPKPLIPAFEKAVEGKEKESILLNRKPRRRMYKGEFLFAPDFQENPVEASVIKPPAGYAVVTVPVSPENSPGRQLLPGSSYVTLYGDFDFDPDEKKERIETRAVLHNVQVKGVGGITDMTSAAATSQRTYDNIQIVIRESQAVQIFQVQRILKSRRFVVTPVHQPEGVGAKIEPEFDKDVLDLIAKIRAPQPVVPPMP